MNISIEQLFKSGAYFGHSKRFRNPQMEKYIFAERQGINIIDLQQTKACFEDALQFIQKTIEAKGTMIFVGTKATAQKLVAEEANRCHMPYVDRRWLGGMLTNFKTVRSSVKRLVDLSTDLEAGKLAGLTKKERLCRMREHSKLEASLGGVREMDRLPDALFVIDVKHEAIAVAEANKLGIPVIGLVDTNASPAGVDYVIPGNDDAMSSLRFFISHVADVVKDIKDKQLAEEEKKKVQVSRIKKKAAASSETSKEEAPKEEAVKAEAEKPAVKKVVKKKTTAAKTEEVKEEKKPAEKKPAVKKTTAKAKKTVEAKEEKKPAAKKAPTKAAAEKKTTKPKATKKVAEKGE